MNKRHRAYQLNAVALFRSHQAAILSTMSPGPQQCPFGSLITYASGQDRTLYMYASDIAEHTKNLRNNHRACVTVCQLIADGDPQNSARLSLMGEFTQVSDQHLEACRQRFTRFLPASRKYADMHDFNFYRFAIDKVRWIGGFGEVAWLDTEHWRTPSIEWAAAESAIVAHVNEDHRNVIYSSLRGHHSITDPEANMLALCTDGYYIQSHDKLYFIPFEEPQYDANGCRQALIHLANHYRQFE